MIIANMLCAIFFTIVLIISAKADGASNNYVPDLSHLNGLGDRIRQQVHDSLQANGIHSEFHPHVSTGQFISGEYDPFSPDFLGEFHKKMKKLEEKLAVMGAMLKMQQGISGVTIANFNGQQLLIHEGTQHECEGIIIKPTSAGNVPECQGNLKAVNNPCLPINSRATSGDYTCIGKNIYMSTVNGYTKCYGGTLYSNNELAEICGDSSNIMFEYYPSPGNSISPLVNCENPGQFYCIFNSAETPFIHN